MHDGFPMQRSKRLYQRTRRAHLLLAALIALLVALATVLQVGGAVVGSGVVAVSSSVNTVTHPTGGVLTALWVHEGDHVASGQPLMAFDTSVSRVGSQSASIGVDQLVATRARLEAEQGGAAIPHFPAGLTAAHDPVSRKIVADELRLFQSRRIQQRSSENLLIERIRQYDAQVRATQAQISAIDEQMMLIQPEIDGLRRLYGRQLVTINRLNQMERTASQFRGSKAALQSNIAEVRAHISETREQIVNLRKTRSSEAASELVVTSAQLNEQNIRLASANDNYQRSTVRAPRSGIVDRIMFTTMGSFVPGNQSILNIVPDHDDLIIDGHISPQDVDQVRVGQAARITFSGLNRQTTPDVAATVTFISADLTRDDRTGASYYRIRVRLNAASLTAAPTIKLQPGMPAEIFVQTGNRSILSFLLKPLFDQIRYALRSD